MTYENAVQKLADAFGLVAAIEIAAAIQGSKPASSGAKVAKPKAERPAREYIAVEADVLAAFQVDYLAAKAAFEHDKTAYVTLARRLGFASPMALGAVARTGNTTAEYAAKLAETYSTAAINAKPAKKVRRVAK